MSIRVSQYLVDVLGTNQVTTQIHDIPDGGVWGDTSHPQIVVQGRGVVRVSIVIHDSSAGEEPAIAGETREWGNASAAHLRKTAGQVVLLPSPPEAVEVGVMKEEERVAGRSGLVLKLSCS